MQINKSLTPYNHTIGTAEHIKYVVIHYVNVTGGAEANCKWYASANRKIVLITLLDLMDPFGSP